MSTKIAAALALLLALAGWGLYHQISVNGGLQKQIEQREQQLHDATSRIDELGADIKARDEASKLLEAERDDLRKRTAEVRTVVRKVYIQPDVQPWADTVPPAAVVDAIGSGIACLWKSADGGGNADCSAIAARRDNGGLPAP